MFATIKSLIPEPRQPEQPRHYVGRHRQTESVSARAAVPIIASVRSRTVPVVAGPEPAATAGPAAEIVEAEIVEAEFVEPVALPVRRTVPQPLPPGTAAAS